MNLSDDIIYDGLFSIREEGIVIESYAEVFDDSLMELRQNLFNEDSILVTVDINRLRAEGVPEYIIEKILGCNLQLSAVKITRNAKILLTDYNLEIKMPPLEKSLFLLYLRHPEGIRFKSLCDHSDELMAIYSSMTGRSDQNAIRQSIESLTDPLSNSVNEKCSNIKKAFTKAFSSELAKQYYIDGKSGEAKTIALDRSLVSWDEEV